MHCFKNIESESPSDLFEANNYIEKLRVVEIEILDKFVEVCLKNNIHYSLAYGTLIGAVRHHGFIPWDDDIDILMLRKDYERFIEAWYNENITDYYIQNYKTDITYTNNFMKIRKDHTTFIEEKSDRNNKKNRGIFIDIFPLDVVPKGKIKRVYHFIICAINLLYSRGYTSKSSKLLMIIERALLMLPNSAKVKIRLWTEEQKQKWNGLRGELCNSSTIEESKIFFPEDMMDDFTLLDFNGKKYSSMKKYDEFLCQFYGDYMKLPPVEQRIWQHNPFLICFDKNYDEII